MRIEFSRKAALPLIAAITLIASPAVAQQAESTEPYNRDVVVNTQIREELQQLPYTGVFDWFEWTYNKGEVTLDGSVWRPINKESAEKAVKRVQGVDSVVNNIDVQPASPSDDRIRMAVYRAIYGHSGLQRYALQVNPPIRIIVDRGNVTLEGTVATRADSTIAYTQASAVPGIFSVENNLQVERSGN